MSAVWYWSARTIRRRARSYVGAALLLALLGGLTLASLAGARRTASAYPRFRAAGQATDVRVNADGYELGFPELAGSIPGVTGTATYLGVLAYPLLPGGEKDPSYDPEVVASVDGEYFTRDRFTATRGRLPDPGREDEIAVNEYMARLHGTRLGQRFEMGVYDAADEFAVRGPTPPPPAFRIAVTVVGIGLFPEEVVEDDTDRVPRMLFTPAFAERAQGLASYAWTGVDLEGGAGDVDRFKRDYFARLSPGQTALFRATSASVARAQDAVRPLAVALGVFGLLAAGATLLLGGQAVARLVRADRDDVVTLRAMGAGPGVTGAVGLPGAAASILAGVAGAVGVAVALSPLAPIGPLRRVEADPGVSLDWTVLGVGGSGLVLTLAVVAAVAAIRQAPHRRQAAGTAEPPRRSLVVGVVASAGLPVPAVTGVRLALESGAGRTAVPLRAALGGAVVAVAAVVASLVFGTSLQALVDTPRLYGWDWDLTVRDAKGFGGIDLAQAHALLDAEPAVLAWSGVFFQSFGIEGRVLAVLGVDPAASVLPPVLSGRPVRGRGEIVLGSKTLADLGKSVGQTVMVESAGGESQELRIVGTAVLPTLGAIQNPYTSLGEGAMVVYDQVPGWDAFSADPKALFIRLAAGADRGSATERIAAIASQVGLGPASDGYPGSAELLPVQRPAQIVNYESIGATPSILGGVLVVAALVSLGLTLASSVHRRRRDLSILKSLGFTRGQVSAVVVWQSSIIVAVGLLVGVPVGIALGRWMWILFAQRLPVLALPTVPLLALAALAGGLLVLANVVAAVPARQAGRTPVAAILRSE